LLTLCFLTTTNFRNINGGKVATSHLSIYNKDLIPTLPLSAVRQTKFGFFAFKKPPMQGEKLLDLKIFLKFF
jgi:hypothetical protein